MMTRWSLAVAAVACLHGTGIGAQSRTPAATDSARLQGSWAMISGSADGYAMPPGLMAQMKRVFTGNTLTVTMGASLYFSATIQLNPATTPKTINYHMTGGPTTGSVQLGIYRLAGDTAWFCFGAPGDLRPADFTTTAGDHRTLSSWVRVKS